jgi:hypothetical protein
MVSILVLVDLAREYSVGGTKIATMASFNPCFSGSCSRIVFKKVIYSITLLLFCLCLFLLGRAG